MSKEITISSFNKRYEKLQRFKQNILAIQSHIKKILMAGGLTYDGASLDLYLFEKEIDKAGSEIERLRGKRPLQGIFAAIIPYDVPVFLHAMYTAIPYLAGYPVVFRFPSIMKDLNEIYREALKGAGITSIEIETKSGKEFGKECIDSPEVVCLILAGAKEIVDHYSSPEIASKFKRLFLLGPTRPKLVLFESFEPERIRNIVEESLYSSGQICGLYKEVIVPEKIYNDVLDQMAHAFENIDFGSPENTVGPIRNKGSFEHAKRWIKEFKASPNYRIVIGGNVHEDPQLIEPTLVEVVGDIDHSIELFAPIMLIRKAKNNEHAIKLANEDKIHGLLAGIYAKDPVETHRYLGKLAQQHGIVLANATIMQNPRSDFKTRVFSANLEVCGSKAMS